MHIGVYKKFSLPISSTGSYFIAQMHDCHSLFQDAVKSISSGSSKQTCGSGSIIENTGELR